MPYNDEEATRAITRAANNQWRLTKIWRPSLGLRARLLRPRTERNSREGDAPMPPRARDSRPNGWPIRNSGLRTTQTLARNRRLYRERT